VTLFESRQKPQQHLWLGESDASFQSRLLSTSFLHGDRTNVQQVLHSSTIIDPNNQIDYVYDMNMLGKRRMSNRG
jgi:hypothetical protein